MLPLRRGRLKVRQKISNRSIWNAVDTPRVSRSARTWSHQCCRDRSCSRTSPGLHDGVNSRYGGRGHRFPLRCVRRAKPGSRHLAGVLLRRGTAFQVNALSSNICVWSNRWILSAAEAHKHELVTKAVAGGSKLEEIIDEMAHHHAQDQLQRNCRARCWGRSRRYNFRTKLGGGGGVPRYFRVSTKPAQNKEMRASKGKNMSSKKRHS